MGAAGRLQIDLPPGLVGMTEEDMKRRGRQGEVQTHPLADDQEWDRHRDAIAAACRQIGGDQLVADILTERIGLIVAEGATAVPIARLGDHAAQRRELLRLRRSAASKHDGASGQPVDFREDGVDIQRRIDDPVKSQLC